jgi:hypothetical protein
MRLAVENGDKNRGTGGEAASPEGRDRRGSTREPALLPLSPRGSDDLSIGCMQFAGAVLQGSHPKVCGVPLRASIHNESIHNERSGPWSPSRQQMRR